MPMGEKTKTTQLESLIEEILSPTAFELVLCTFRKQGKDWFLQVFIDHPEGITLDHCVAVTRLLSASLDERDPIEHAYQLEVSSPGVDRPLVKRGDFTRFVGHRVYLKLHQPKDGRKTFVGTLISFEDDQIDIELEENRERSRIPLGDIAKATLKPVLDFN